MSDQEVSARRFLDLLIRDLERALGHARNAMGCLVSADEYSAREDPRLPPTARQIAYAKQLGIRISGGMSRWELSRAISRELEKRRTF